MNDEQRLLASAVLDDAATSDERTRAGADPEVRAEIERLQAVRDQLRAGVEPDPARREASIAAALAAFEVGGDRVAAPPPPSLDARRRARWLGPLAAAAALVVIVVGAVLAGGDDDGGDDAASPAATELAPAVAVDRDATAGAEEAATASTAGEASAAGAPSPAASDLTASDQLVATAPAAAEVLRTPAELAAFAQRRLALDAGAVGEVTCAEGTPLGSAFFVVGGAEVPVEVFEVDGAAIAVDVVDCSIVARAPLP